MEFGTDADVAKALRATAEELPESAPAVSLVVAGASAALLGGLLGRGRATTDCDIVRAEPDDAWDLVAAAAAAAARRLGLREGWLSRDCQMYAWSLPLGWRERCERVGAFGPLDVWRLSRLDLISSKILSAPKRPQDMEDLRAMAPTAEELRFAAENLDRLSTESLDNEAFDDQRVVIAHLEASR